MIPEQIHFSFRISSLLDSGTGYKFVAVLITVPLNSVTGVVIDQLSAIRRDD